MLGDETPTVRATVSHGKLRVGGAAVTEGPTLTFEARVDVLVRRVSAWASVWRAQRRDDETTRRRDDEECCGECADVFSIGDGGGQVGSDAPFGTVTGVAFVFYEVAGGKIAQSVETIGIATGMN